MTNAVSIYVQAFYSVSGNFEASLSALLPILSGFDAHAKVFQWIEFAQREWPRLTAHGVYPAFTYLHDYLISRVYLADSQFSIADAVVFDLVYSGFSALSKEDRIKCSALTRWFDHIQSNPIFSGNLTPAPIQLNVDFIPRSFDKPMIPEPSASSAEVSSPVAVEEKKDKKKAAPKAADAQTNAEKPVKEAREPKEPKEPKELKEPKEPKESKEAKKPKDSKESKEVVGEEDITVDLSKLDFRVALIKKAWKHPDAESLYVEEVDLNEKAPRTVVSGLVGKVPLEEMQERLVVVLANLKPASLKGIKSEAMVLAATGADGKVELVTPPKDAKIGERISFAGVSGEPEAVLNPKKRHWEKVQPLLRTGEDCVAYFKELPFTTSAGSCFVKSVAGATIR